MRIVLSLIIMITVFSACKKDKFTTVPQIKFKSISPDRVPSNLPNTAPDEAKPMLTLRLTDLEGDIGFVAGKDTSRVYVKNLVTNRLDSFFLPNINSAGTKNFEADLVVNLQPMLGCRAIGPVRPRIDTTYFEVYVVDFKKNKSDVIKTDKPLFVQCN